MKVGQVARPWSQGGCETREEGGPGWRIIKRNAGSSRAVGTHLSRQLYLSQPVAMSDLYEAGSAGMGLARSSASFEAGTQAIDGTSCVLGLSYTKKASVPVRAEWELTAAVAAARMQRRSMYVQSGRNLCYVMLTKR